MVYKAARRRLLLHSKANAVRLGLLSRKRAYKFVHSLFSFVGSLVRNCNELGIASAYNLDMDQHRLSQPIFIVFPTACAVQAGKA